MLHICLSCLRVFACPPCAQALLSPALQTCRPGPWRGHDLPQQAGPLPALLCELLHTQHVIRRRART